MIIQCKFILSPFKLDFLITWFSIKYFYEISRKIGSCCSAYSFFLRGFHFHLFMYVERNTNRNGKNYIYRFFMWWFCTFEIFWHDGRVNYIKIFWQILVRINDKILVRILSKEKKKILVIILRLTFLVKINIYF